jgi:hypothetical protein
MESTRVASVADPTESIVSDAMRGEESVKSPACDWCGDMPGLFGGGLFSGLVGTPTEWIRMQTKKYEAKVWVITK